MFVSFFRAFSAVIMSVVTFFVSPFAGNITQSFAPRSPADVNLTFSTIADTHLTDSQARVFMLELGLNDMQSATRELDAMVIVGDITDHSYEEDWQNVQKAFSGYTPAKNIVLVEGNHDTWATDDDTSFDVSKERFFRYNEQICSRELENVYYSTVINGYTFVVLGSEDDGVDAYVSDEQLAWLERTMSRAALDGLPIFVFFHQPINMTHGLPQTWGDADYDDFTGGIGEQSEKVENILQRYENVFFISGHIHSGIGDVYTSKVFGYKSVETHGNLTCVNLPSYMYMSPRGQVMSGIGFVFEVYDEEVLIRARSYSSNTWYTAYEYGIDLV